MPFENLYSELFSDLENSKFSLGKSWIFVEKRSKICLSPSEYKLESCNFTCPCFARLSIKWDTQVWNFIEFAKEFSWKILRFSLKWSKMCLSPSGYKLESWNFAWTCFARLSRKLHTQVWKNPEIFFKNGQNCVFVRLLEMLLLHQNGQKALLV
jgi:hypothetical protein